MSERKPATLPEICLAILERDGGAWTVAEIVDHIQTKHEAICDRMYVTKSSVAKAVHSLVERKKLVREAADAADAVVGVIPTKWRFRIHRNGPEEQPAGGHPTETAPRTAPIVASDAGPAVSPFASVSVAFSRRPAHRLEQVLARGLLGDSPPEVVERIVRRYLEDAFA